MANYTAEQVYSEEPRHPLPKQTRYKVLQTDRMMRVNKEKAPYVLALFTHLSQKQECLKDQYMHHLQ